MSTFSFTTRPVGASPVARLRPGPAQALTFGAESASGQDLAAGPSVDGSLQNISSRPPGEEPGPSGHEPMVALALPYNIAERMVAFLESHPVQSPRGGMGVEELEAPPAYEPRSVASDLHTREDC
ncbi:hypothetical protein NUW54_g11811 [Trametes sanguinea]|uniref:Uncharacterized protein n=1 Tax=Trametes sanguinea TaxID=158606 RepID=A0ACC1N8K2_9APHY|nr:hypothetical protein NUW54_g11811 [Trametes sanguinea]